MKEKEEITKAELYFILQEELNVYKKMMGQAQQTVLDQEITKFPIFVVHQQEVAIGIELVDKEKVIGNWSMNLSTLEEFVTKSIITEKKIKDFKISYKSTDSYFCCFVLSELGAQFVYLPKETTILDNNF